MSSTCTTGIMLEQFARCNFHGLIGQDSRLPQSFFFPVDLMNFHLTFFNPKCRSTNLPRIQSYFELKK